MGPTWTNGIRSSTGAGGVLLQRLRRNCCQPRARLHRVERLVAGAVFVHAGDLPVCDLEDVVDLPSRLAGYLGQVGAAGPRASPGRRRRAARSPTPREASRRLRGHCRGPRRGWRRRGRAQALPDDLGMQVALGRHQVVAAARVDPTGQDEREIGISRTLTNGRARRAPLSRRPREGPDSPSHRKTAPTLSAAVSATHASVDSAARAASWPPH